MWFLHFFKMKQPAAPLTSKNTLRFKSSGERQKEKTFSTNCQVIMYLLATWAPDDVIDEAHAEIMRFTSLLNKTLIEYAELLRAKALRCFRVYDEYVLKNNFL